VDNTPTVVLPCPPDQFRDFIAGLLGRAQTIETGIEGPFEVRKENVESLFHLLGQRIGSQNEATLVQFTARIIYDDNSSVLLNSLQDFLAYNEVKPLISVALHLSWTYLIKFQNKKFPEKQVIEVSFDTTGQAIQLSGVGSLQMLYRKSPPIILRIEHTDRTWGADIEALLRGNLELLQQHVGRARCFANKFAGRIGAVAAVLALALTLFTTYRISCEFAVTQLSKLSESVKGLTGNASIVTAKQIDFLVNLVTAGVWTRFTLFSAVLLIALGVGSIFFGGIVSDYARVVVPSFVLLTNQSFERKKIENQRLTNSWYKLVGTFLGAVGIGVLSNAVFLLALKYLGVPA
jgi:hypothetical protein